MDITALAAPQAAPDLQFDQSHSRPTFEAELQQFEPRIKASSRRYGRTAAHVDDLHQAGRIALWHARRAYNSDFGTPFDHYAARAISRGVRDEANRELRHWAARAGEPHYADDQDGESILDSVAGSGEHKLLHDVEIAVLEGRVANLQQSHRDLFSLRFRHDHSQAEAAQALGVTQQRVSQLESELVRMLRLTG